MISNHFDHGGSSETGLTKEVDWKELRSLDHLSIEFSSPEGMQGPELCVVNYFELIVRS